VSGTKVNGAAFKELRVLKELQTLDLSDTDVNDAVMKFLKDLPKLGCLFLEKTGVTDAGIMELAGNRTLRELRCDGHRGE
jgi:hypothetical protein